MAVSYASITGRVTFPGSDTGLPGLVTAVPLTRAAGLVIAGDRLTQGVVSAPVDADGNLPVGGLKVPIVSVSGTPVLWRLVFEPASVTARSEIGNKGLLPWQFYLGPITASATVQALATTEPTAILANFPPTLVAQAQQAATDAATSAAAAAAVGATSDAQQANNTTNGPLTKAALSASIAQLKTWAKNPDQLVAGAVSYTAGLLSSAVVAWPDGLPGVLTITTRQSGTDAVTGYTITRVNGSTTTTYTQPTITRDSSGLPTTVPQITVA